MFSSTLTTFERVKTDIADAYYLYSSRSLDIGDVKSVCLALGPYRNLTTLTASTLFLHPNCQVLNHAGYRVFGNKEIDFLLDFEKTKLDRFIQYAIKISSKGERGDKGGSITHSHAFDSKHRMKDIFQSTGHALTKQNIKCLFWKESLRTSNIIRERRIDLGKIFQADDRLLFLLPIRNPLDCAASNLRTGHVEIFKGLSKSASIFDVLKAILDEIFWFALLKERHPDRFFYFFEHSISREMLAEMARFLRLDPEETWIANSLSAMKIKPGYDHNPQLIDYYKSAVTERSTSYPALSKQLLLFAS